MSLGAGAGLQYLSSGSQGIVSFLGIYHIFTNLWRSCSKSLFHDGIWVSSKFDQVSQPFLVLLRHSIKSIFHTFEPWKSNIFIIPWKMPLYQQGKKETYYSCCLNKSSRRKYLGYKKEQTPKSKFLIYTSRLNPSLHLDLGSPQLIPAFKSIGSWISIHSLKIIW